MVAVKLAVSDLTFGYDGKTTLDGISLEIEKGDIVSLVGPNGAGKSTLIKCIDKILKPQKGGSSAPSTGSWGFWGTPTSFR